MGHGAAFAYSIRSTWFERPVRFRIPFRFGAVTVTAATQLFLHAEIETEDGRRSLGATAELMVPKWFDKDPALTPEQTVDELRRALVIARELYLARTRLRHRVRSACRLSCRRSSQACAREGIPGARGGLRAGADRQGDPGCAAAR